MKKWWVEDMEHSVWVIEAETPYDAAIASVWEGETVERLPENTVTMGGMLKPVGESSMTYFDVFDRDGINTDGRCVWPAKEEDDGTVSRE